MLVSGHYWAMRAQKCDFVSLRLGWFLLAGHWRFPCLFRDRHRVPFAGSSWPQKKKGWKFKATCGTFSMAQMWRDVYHEPCILSRTSSPDVSIPKMCSWLIVPSIRSVQRHTKFEPDSCTRSSHEEMEKDMSNTFILLEPKRVFHASKLWFFAVRQAGAISQRHVAACGNGLCEPWACDCAWWLKKAPYLERVDLSP